MRADGVIGRGDALLCGFVTRGTALPSLAVGLDFANARKATGKARVLSLLFALSVLAIGEVRSNWCSTRATRIFLSIL